MPFGPLQAQQSTLEAVEKGSISVTTFKEAEEEDRRYWFSKSPAERLLSLEFLRRMNYGHDPATASVQRHLEIAERA